MPLHTAPIPHFGQGGQGGQGGALPTNPVSGEEL